MTDVLIIPTTLPEAVEFYAGLGLYLFMCAPFAKEPLGGNGHLDATNDPAVLRAWWAANPTANIGCCPGMSGHFVVDVDGAEGEDTLAALELEHGLLPVTMTFRTPRGGRHLWFKGRCASTVGKLGRHLDTRGYNGYVLMAPSHVIDKAKGIDGAYRLEMPNV